MDTKLFKKFREYKNLKNKHRFVEAYVSLKKTVEDLKENEESTLREAFRVYRKCALNGGFGIDLMKLIEAEEE